MNKETVEASVAAANRFLELTRRLVYRPTLDGRQFYLDTSPKVTGEVRRASMDLTRRLAEMRRYGE